VRSGNEYQYDIMTSGTQHIDGIIYQHHHVAVLPRVARGALCQCGSRALCRCATLSSSPPTRQHRQHHQHAVPQQRVREYDAQRVDNVDIHHHRAVVAARHLREAYARHAIRCVGR